MHFTKYQKKGVLLFAVFFILLNFMGTGYISAAEAKFNMSYIYFGDSSIYKGYVDRTKGSLNEISPNYFNFNDDGSLLLTDAVSRSFVDQMHAEGVTVVPFLSNHWDRAMGVAALLNREALADSIAAAVSAYDLDGVNVDLENLTQNERAAYVDFVRLLSEKLPDGKTVAVAVAVNPYGATTGWQGSYDYTGLSQVCDYLMLMAYDEHYQNDPTGAGPVASFSFTERSVQYAVSRASSDKIVLGIPFYGRIWKNGGGYPNGYGISNQRVDDLIAQYNGRVYYDDASQSPYAVITVGSSDTKPVVGGTKLTSGTYTIWYENDRSIQQKLALVAKYNLKGTGSWSLGQETESTWNYYKLWLNGCYFYDIVGHWAQNSIFSAYQKGWIKGVSEYAFCPEQPLTRAQAAVLLVRMLNLPVYDAAASFDDTSGHWAGAYIETARQYDIISGVGDNRFDPDSPVTREQMAVMLSNLQIEFPEGTGAAGYFDISAAGNPWSFDAIIQMSRAGIIQGFPDGSFGPGKVLTRAQMAVMMERMSDFLNRNLY